MRYDQQYKINPEYRVEDFDNELLLYSESKTKGIHLNDSAYLVWLLCREGMTAGQTIQHLQEIYPNQKGSIEADVICIYDSFIAAEIIIASKTAY